MSYFGDLFINVTKWSYLAFVLVWLVGIVRMFFGRPKLAYLSALAAIVFGLSPLAVFFFPRNAFEFGKGEWVMGVPIMAGIATGIAIGMLVLSALAHGLIKFRDSRQKSSGVNG